MPQGRNRPSPFILLSRGLINNDQLVLTLLAVVIGTIVGSLALLFIEKIDLFQQVFLGISGEAIAAYIESLPAWRVVLTPTIGGLLVGLLIYYVMTDQRPKGPVDVIEACEVGGGRMSLKNGLIAMLASALSIGSGASVGREGPAVHMGATFAAFVAEKLKMARSNSQILLGCGVAAAVSASFNAPIAGALFAQEVILSHYALKAFAPVVISSVSGTVLAHQIVGNSHEFKLEGFEIVSYLEFPAFAGLGILCGLIGVLFIVSILKTQSLTAKIPTPPWTKPAIGGFLVGLIALYFPEVLGVGYEATENALMGNYALGLLFGILVFKFVATVLSLGFGFNGGVFSPSLVIGAMLGGSFGMVVTMIAPELSSGAAAYSLIGMAAVAAAVLGAPISTTLIVFELTGDYNLTIAVMMACVLSTLMSHQLGRQSFFVEQLIARGIDLVGNHRNLILRQMNVGDILTRHGDYLRVDSSLKHIRSCLRKAEGGIVFVLNFDRSLYGVIKLSEVSEDVFDTQLDKLIVAKDIADPRPPVLELNDNLEIAQSIFVESGYVQIAVVDQAHDRAFVGVLDEREIIVAYDRELISSRKAEQGST